MISHKTLTAALSATLLISLQTSAQQGSLELNQLVRFESCLEPVSQEEVVIGSDFKWNQNLEEIKQRGENLYHSGKRLRSRAFMQDEQTLVVPVNVPSGGQQLVALTPDFILSVRRHIEEGLRLGYVDSIIFSDMGHSHFFIPDDFYRDEIAPLEVNQRALLYEKVLAHPGLKVLYHTAEQLRMLDEDRALLPSRKLQWRFFTRNLIGDNRGQGKMELFHEEGHSYNTASSNRPGYRYWGAGYYITANKDGCFAYTHEGETKYFDLNLEGIDFTAGASNF